MTRLIRKVVLGSASVLALGIGGAALDSIAGAGNAADAGSMAVTAGAQDNTGLPDARIWKDDVRWAQIELRNDGLYHGSLDGVIGRQTKRALEKFQQDNGLDRTAALDPPTWKALTDHRDIGQGSSTPPASERGASDAGR
jgi:peptidoglycan hydrolase-like protein with peptidoglycan-binding domain